MPYSKIIGLDVIEKDGIQTYAIVHTWYESHQILIRATIIARCISKSIYL